MLCQLCLKRSYSSHGSLYFEAKVTDEGSGVASVGLVLNDVVYPMTANGDIYGVQVPYEQMQIVHLPGRPEIDLNLTYNSQGGRVSIFGENWAHNYNSHVTEMDNPAFTA